MKKFWNWLFSPPVAGLIGIAGFVFAIYTAFFYERKPELTISVDSMSRVFDLYQPVGGLEVSYAGEDLRSSKKNLWLLTTTIKNTGNAEVRKGDYDENAPLGLNIEGAVIAEQPTLKTNTTYLEKNLKIITSDNSISFSPIILEPGDSFEITTLLLGSGSSKPSISTLGKLAGVRSIAISTPENPTPSKPVWQQAVDASSWWVHPVRWIIYFFGPILSIGLSIAMFEAIANPLRRIKNQRLIADRQRRIREYRQYEELGKESRYLIDEYVAKGEAGLIPVARYLKTYNRRRSLVEVLVGKLDDKEVDKLVRAATPFRRGDAETENNLKAIKLAEGEGAHIEVSAALREALADLCLFLDIDLDKLSSRITSQDLDDFAIAVHTSQDPDHDRYSIEFRKKE